MDHFRSSYLSLLRWMWFFRKMCANDRRSSIQARLMPKHIRGPRENGTSQWSRSGFANQRSGRNLCGDGNRVGLKWTKVAPQETMVWILKLAFTNDTTLRLGKD